MDEPYEMDEFVYDMAGYDSFYKDAIERCGGMVAKAEKWAWQAKGFLIGAWVSQVFWVGFAVVFGWLANPGIGYWAILIGAMGCAVTYLGPIRSSKGYLSWAKQTQAEWATYKEHYEFLRITKTPLPPGGVFG